MHRDEKRLFRQMMSLILIAFVFPLAFTPTPQNPIVSGQLHKNPSVDSKYPIGLSVDSPQRVIMESSRKAAVAPQTYRQVKGESGALHWASGQAFNEPGLDPTLKNIPGRATGSGESSYGN